MLRLILIYSKLLLVGKRYTSNFTKTLKKTLDMGSWRREILYEKKGLAAVFSTTILVKLSAHKS